MSAGISPWTPVEMERSQAVRRRVRLPVVPAAGSDHAAVCCFLAPIFQGMSRAEFRASLDDAAYEPRDRLLVRRGPRILAHAHVTHRVLQFGPLQLPVAGLHGLAVAPECRGQGLGGHLLAAAERHMLQCGALIGLLRTRVPHFFRHRGWAMCGRQNYSRANARAVMAKLLDMGHAPRRQRALHIRPFRRWELCALDRVYRQNQVGTFGPFERSESYWEWLVARRGYDQLYVALEGPEQDDVAQTAARVVGYAALRGEQIVELHTMPGQSRVAAELLARCCGDAVEHDRHCVLLHAPPEHPLHEVFVQAGGIHHYQAADRREVAMARLLDPLKLLRCLCGEFWRRAELARLPRPCELGLLVEGRKYQIEVAREQCTASTGHVGRSYLHLNVADFTRLLLGEIDWDCAVAEGRLEISTHTAAVAGRVLLPNLPLWRPPLDDLQAIDTETGCGG